MLVWRLGHCLLVSPIEYEPINVHYEKNFICLGLMRSMYETYWIVGLNFMKKGVGRERIYKHALSKEPFDLSNFW